MKNILLTISLSLFTLSPVLAEDKLPEMMVGQTTIVMNKDVNNTSLKFDGNDRVNLGDSTKITDIINQANKSISVEFWYKYDGPGTGSWNTVLTKNNTGSGGNDPFLFYVYPDGSDKHCMSGRSNSGSEYGGASNDRYNYGFGCGLANDRFHHAAFVFNYSTQTIKAYIDGALFGTTPVSDLNNDGINNDPWYPKYNAGNLVLGTWEGRYFNGKLDELRIYNRPLGDSEIAQSYFNSVYDSGTSLIGYWNFDGNFNDSSANPFPAGINTGATFVSDSYGPTKTYYGGYTGNEAVLNYNSSGKTTGTSLAPSAVFNGTSNYVDAGKASDITGTGGFAYSAWFKRDRSAPVPETLPGQPYYSSDHWADHEYIISQYSDGYSDSVLFFDHYDKLRYRLYSGTNPANKFIALESPNPIAYNDKTWHHVVIVRGNNGMDGEMWLDGVKIASDYNNSGKIPVNMLDYTNSRDIKTGIGYEFVVSDNVNRPGYFKGNISSVRIYNRALTSPEITALFNESSSVPTDTKLYLKLTDNSSTIKDYSPNNYSGITFNGTWSDDGPLPNPESSDLLGFSKDTLLNCANNGMIPDPARCFTLNTNPTGMKLMTSRTYVNNNPIIEVAALRYPDKTVIGDVYGSLSNFAFWGKSANQGSGVTNSNSDATYKIGYAINENAQASLSGEQYQSYINKTKEFVGEAQELQKSDIYAPNSWYLQGSSLTDNSSSDKNKYPEGKIWSVNANGGSELKLKANTTYTYYGKGTLIIHDPGGTGDDLNFESGSKLVPGDSESRLGIILMDGNNITFSGNNKIQAAILCYTDPTHGETFTVNGSNSTFTGSFVARTFAGMGGTNIRFYYDYAYDEAWPPGFKYLNMPHAEVK